MQKMKKLKKRILSFALATAMALTSTGIDSRIVRAGEVQSPEVSPLAEDPDEEVFTLYAGTQSLRAVMDSSELGSAVDFSQGAKITYGSPIEFSVKDQNGDPNALVGVWYGTKEEIQYEGGNISFASLRQHTDDDILSVGDYYLFYQSEHGGSDGTGGVVEFAMRIVPKKLATPTGLAWGTGANSMTANWNAVTKDVDEESFVGTVNVTYTASLYYENESTPFYTESGLTTTSYDFKSVITKPVTDGGKGYGNYKYKVEAISSSSNYSNTSAIVENAFVYKDTEEPVVDEFYVSDDNGALTLHAHAKDTGIGIKSFAFATSDTEESNISWTNLDTPVNDETGYDAEANVSEIGNGTIYFYVKDAHDNVTKQTFSTSEGVDGSDIVVSKVTLKNRYVENVSTDLEKYILGTETFTLPSALEMSKTGHTFQGWYGSSDFSDSSITDITPDSSLLSSGGSVDIYGKWSSQSVNFVTQPNNIQKTYDAKSSTLTASLSEDITYDNLEWKWYYKADDDAEVVTVDGVTVSEKSSSITVKDVANSGKYYAVATVHVAGMEDVTATTDTATVEITERVLKIKIQDEKVTYRENAPTFSFVLVENGTNEGLAGEDSISSLFGEDIKKIQTSYRPGDSVREDGYPITYNDSLTKPNYDVKVTDGTLTVEPLDLSDSEMVTIDLSQDTYTYDGTEKKPVVTKLQYAPESEEAVTLIQGEDKDFTYSYQNNIYAGKTGATGTAVVVSFHGNYTGTIVKNFVINKGVYDVRTSMSGWKYGETPENPGVDALQGGSVVYYYLEVSKDSDGEYLDIDKTKTGFEALDKSGKTTTKPVNAGRYYVWAEIDATDNYESITASPAVFDIAPREIQLSVKDQSWPYDGNEHSYGTIDITGDGFHGHDDFLWYTASGSIREIGSKENIITYKLTSATLERNYNIRVTNGWLKITPTKLVPPSTFNWAQGVPGSLSWIAITKDNLDVKYKVNLYRTKLTSDGEVQKDAFGNPIYDEEPVHTIITDDTSCNFLPQILEDSAEIQYGYSATIQVLPQYKEGEAHNYEESEPSKKVTPRFAIKISMEKQEPAITDSYIYNLENPDDYSKSSVVLFQGQSVPLGMKSATGYSTGTFGARDQDTTGNEIDDSAVREYVKISYADIHPLLTINETELTKPKHVIVSATGNDKSPILNHFEASMVEDYSKIFFDIEMSDELGLKGYYIVKREQPFKEDEIFSIEGAVYKDIPKENDEMPKSYHVTEEITEPGFYYICPTDGNLYTYYKSWYIPVYQVSFDDGVDDDSVTGEMPKLFKLKDSEITLPDHKYKKAGFEFTNWTGTTGIYPDGGKYVANANDVLKAGWTDSKVHCKVRYFYQTLTEVTEEDGKTTVSSIEYVEDTDNVNNLTVAYGKEYSYNSKDIQHTKEGYSLTAAPIGIADYNTGYEITEDGQEICLYYNLNQYDITYSYLDQNAQRQQHIEKYYYGQTVNSYEQPSATGCNFIGWNWGDAGHKPETMPSNALSVTGEFVPEQLQYKVVYYFQDLDQNPENATNHYVSKTFSMDASMTESLKGHFGENLFASVDAPDTVPLNTTSVVARQVTGFTPVAVQINYGNAITNNSADDFEALTDGTKKTATGTIQKQLTDAELENEAAAYKNGPTYICFYYKRNIYNLTMDVYKDAREEGIHLFGSYYDGTDSEDNDNAKWTFPYGYKFADESDASITGDGSAQPYKASYFETYGYLPLESNATDAHSEAWTKRWPTGENVASKDKYYLASFIDWSTGARPETMPAGDVSVVREYATKELARYRIEVYVETVTDNAETVTITQDDGTTRDMKLTKATGTYEKQLTYERYGNVGDSVQIVDTMPAEEDKQPNTVYVIVDDIAKGVYDYSYYHLYEHNPANDVCNKEDDPNKEKLADVITENTVENEVYGNVMTLRLNLVRKEYTAYVRYHKKTPTEDTIFAYKTIRAKWGTQYVFDDLAYFDGKEIAGAGEFIEKPEIAKTDFRKGDYVVSDNEYYWIKTGHWDNRQFDTYNDLVKDSSRVWTIGNWSDGKDPKALNPLGSGTDASRSYVEVFYSKPERENHFVVPLKYEDHDTGKYVPMKVTSTEYTELSAYNKTEFQVCVANKCDVFAVDEKHSGAVGPVNDRYPGAAHTKSGYQYVYQQENGKDKLRADFYEVILGYDAYENKSATNLSGTQVTGSGKFYIYAPNGISDGMLYAIDDRNQFYNGNRISLNYNTLYSKSHVGREKFMAEANRPTNGRVVEIANSTSMLVNDKDRTSYLEHTISQLKQHEYNAYYYDVYNEYYLIFNYDGKTCQTCSHHDYAYNQLITSFECNSFSAPDGYHIAWYLDSNCTIPAVSLNITGPTNIYGRSEKNPVENKDYAFYKMAHPLGDNWWITTDNYETFTWNDRTVAIGIPTPETVDNSAGITGTGYEKITKSVDVEYRNEYGATTEMKVLRTEWYVDGELVMVEQPNYSMTYSEFTMNPSLYNRDGFVYDETNVKNKSKAFCTLTPVKMYAYFTRSDLLLTVSRKNTKADNDEVSTRVYGATIRLEDPVKEGYEFVGWKLQEQDNLEDELNPSDYAYTHYDAQDGTPGYTTFKMPAHDTVATAQWKSAAVEMKIYHYLQDSNKTYNQGLLADVLAEDTSDEITVSLNGSDTTAKLYDVDGTAVISRQDGKFTYYYAGMEEPEEDASYDIGLADCFAVVQTLDTLKSEDVVTVRENELPGIHSIFDFAFVKYKYDTTNLTLNEKKPDTDTEDETFEIYYDAEIAYYYERSSNCVIRAIGLGSDDGESGLTIKGAGKHYYGENINLYANMQPNGYTFLGWFKAADVLNDYPADGKPDSLSEMTLKSGVIEQIKAGTVKPVNDTTDFAITVKSSEDYVAITDVAVVKVPTVAISSGRDLDENPYVYGYEDDPTNLLKASITWPDGGAGANAISGYQWYYKYYNPGETVDEEIDAIDLSDMTLISGATSGTYLIPTGKDAGNYVYRCVVSVERKDNARNSQVSGNYQMEVKPDDAYYNVYPVSYQYDGNFYHYNENDKGLENSGKIKKYYSKTEISVDISDSDLETRLNLPEENENKIYTSVGDITYSEVKVDDTSVHTVIPHVTYWYCESLDKNYVSTAGIGECTITPVEVTVTAELPFIKIYDATTKVQGEYNSKKLDGTYSDFHRLQMGVDENGEELSSGKKYYKINGILARDQDKSLVLDFEANYDSRHVIGSTSITLTNMWVEQTDLNDVMRNYNYRFPENTELMISGQIKPYPLSVKWVPKEDSDKEKIYANSDFVYNYDGTDQAPVVYITENNTPDPKSDINLEVGNKQRNVGEYEATVAVSPGPDANYATGDYTFTLTKCPYKILSRYIKVCPKDVTKVYNGVDQTMVKNETVNEFRFFTKENESDEWTEYTSLPTGEKFNVSTDKTGRNVGTYTVSAKDIIITNTSGKNINDNYTISYGTGELTITPCPVLVSGLTAKDKDYDGTTAAELDIIDGRFAGEKFQRILAEESVPVDGLYGTDTLYLDTSKVTASFVNAKAGEDKTVNITIDSNSANEDGGAGALLGDARNNYKLIVDKSQKETTASIFAHTELTVSVKDFSYVYGEQPDYSDYVLNYTGFVPVDNDGAVSSDASHKATFIIKKKNTDNSYTEVVSDGTSMDMSKLDAGTYYVFVKETDGAVDGLYAEDYTIKWNQKPAKLTVTPRPVRIVAADNPAITKEYDNTTTVAAENNASIRENASNKYFTFEKTQDAGVDVSASGIVNSDDVKISSCTTVYNSKDVETANKISVSAVVLGGEKANNYVLEKNSFDLNGAITLKSMTITVDNKTIIYGQEKPEFTYTVNGAVASEKTNVETGVKAAMKPNCGYVNEAKNPNRNVGDYLITVDSSENYQNANCYQNPNYSITFNDGKLTVNKRKVVYRSDDQSMIYKKDPLPTYTGKFVADDSSLENDGFVYGEDVAKVESDLVVQLYSDSECHTAISDNAYTYENQAYENVAKQEVVTTETPAGTYDIKPTNVQGHLYAENYEFINGTGTLTINKYYIRVYNVEVLGKIYDGTTTVDANHLLVNPTNVGSGETKYEYPGVKFDFLKSGGGIETVDYDHMTDEMRKSLDISAKYQSAGISSNSKVDVFIKLKEGSYLDKRYILLTGDTKNDAHVNTGLEITDVTQTETEAFIVGADGKKINQAIEPRPLTLYPTNQKIKYGEDLTVTTDLTKATEAKYSVVKDIRPAVGAVGDAAYVGFVSGEGISNVDGFVLGSKVYVPDNSSIEYAAGSDVGTYTIDISTSTPVEGKTAGNYKLAYQTGTLTVDQNQLSAPTVTWDTDTIGKINWTEVPGIGNVAVHHYVAELKKDGEVVETYTSTDNTVLSHDFSSKMHEAAGMYTVEVHAVASIEKNDSYKNVAKDGKTGTSSDKYAANVTVKFDTSDTATNAATGKTKVERINNVDVEGGTSSYVMIAGEKDINVLFKWGRNGVGTGAGTEYKTGYEVVSCTASSGLTLGTAGTSVEGEYTNTVSLANNHNLKDNLQVVLKLKARTATLTTEVKVEPDALDNIMYGYSGTAGQHVPMYSVVRQHTDTPGVEYDYKYNWYIMLGLTRYDSTNLPKDANKNLITGINWNNEFFVLPLGLVRNQKEYKIYCKVEATRRDNGERASSNGYKELTIIRAKLDESAINITADNWEYGKNHNSKILATKANTAIGDLTLYYKKSTELDTEYTTTKPTDVGTYNVKAVSAENDNYESITSDVQTFSITKATLDKPENLKMTASPTAPYGLVKWDAVTGPKENAGVDSKSSINVKYEVRLTCDKTDGGTKQLGDTVITTDTEYDFTSRIIEKGTYHVYVKAIVDPRKNQAFPEQDNGNCDSSAEAEYKTVITIGAEMASNGITTDSPLGFTKEYNGNDGLTMTVDYSAAGTIAYQWYKNGDTPIAGANSNSYTIKYVEESGYYACMITVDGANPVYTKTEYAKITPRPITAKTENGSKVYDGTALTNSTFTLSYTGEADNSALGEGDSETHTVNGSITYFADNKTKNNTYQNLVIKNGDKIVYTKGGTNNNYTVTDDIGTLSIDKRPITITADSKNGGDAWVYDGSIHSLNTYTYTEYSNSPAQGLASGDKFASVKVTGSITDVGKVDNTPSEAVIKNNNGSGTNVTSNYDITYTKGTLEVVQADASITLCGSLDKTYDGTEVSNPVDKTEGMPEGKAAYEKTSDGAVSFKYYTKSGETYTELPVGTKPKDAGTYYLKAFTAETQNFKAAESDYQEITIAKREVVLTALNKESVYGKDLVELTYTNYKKDTTEVGILDADKDSLDVKITTTATKTRDVADDYPITITYTANDNYIVETVSGKYTIKPATLTVTAQGVDTVYDGENHSITVRATASAVDGDQDKVKIYYSETELNSGNYATAGSTTNPTYKNVKMNGTTVDSYKVYYYVVCNNYEGKAGSQTVKITPRQVSLKADNKSSKYGEDIVALTYQETSTYKVLDADKVGLAITTSTTATKTSPVATYEISINIDTDAASYKNYKFNITKGTYTIENATLQVTANGIEHVYDGTAYGISVSAVADKVAGDQSNVAIYYSTTSALTADNYTTAGSLTNPTYVDVKWNGDTVDSYTVYYYVACPNYTGVKGSETVKITKRPIEITADSQTGDEAWIYNGESHSKDTYTVTTSKETPSPAGLASGDAFASVTVTGSIKDVGTVDNTPSAAVIKNNNGSGTDVTSNYDITYTKGTLEVVQAGASITLSGSLDKTYDGTEVSNPVDKTVGMPAGKATYEKTGDGAVSFKYYTKSGDDYTELPEGTKPKNAGTYYVKAFTSATQNYKAAESGYLEIKIAKREVVLTAHNKESVYGTDLVTLTYTNYKKDTTEVGILDADKDSLDVMITTTAKKTSDVADNYSIIIAYTQNDNYTVKTVDGQYKIKPAALAVTATGVDTVYDGNNHSISVSATAGAISEDQDKVTIYYSETELTSANYATAGTTTNLTYKNVKMNGEAVDNYKVYYYVACDNYEGVAGNETVKITPREVELSADDKGSKHGEDIVPLTYQQTSETKIIEDDLAVLDVKAVTTATNKSLVGTYDIDVTYVANDNYKFNVIKGTYTITDADIIVTASSTEHVYDGTPYSITVNAQAAGSSTENSVVYYSADTELTSENYTTAGTTANPGFVDVKLNGDDVESYTVYYYVACASHVGVSGNKTVKITKRPMEITADSQTGEDAWIYNGESHSKDTYTVTTSTETPSPAGLASGDKITSVTVTGSIKDVGTADNTPSAALIKNDNGDGYDVTDNYDITYTKGTLEVVQSEVSITLSGSLDKMYDSFEILELEEKTNSTPNERPSYEKTGDGTVSFKYYTKSGDAYIELPEGTKPKNAGTYYVKAFTTETQNYKAAESDYKEINISKRTVTLTADNKESIYGQELKTLTYTQGDIKIVDSELAGFEITPQTNVTAESAVGDYPIDIDYVENANYTITVVPGTYKLLNATLSVTSNGVDTIYDGNYYGISVSATAEAVDQDQANVKIYYSETELTSANYKTVGTTTNPIYRDVKMTNQTVDGYKVYYYVACDNYEGVAGSDWVKILPREISLDADNKVGTYGQEIKELTYQQTSSLKIVDDDMAGLSVTPKTTATANSPVGVYEIDIDYTANDNYKFTITKGTYTITNADLSVTALSIEHVYDGTPHGIEVMVQANAVDGDEPKVYYSAQTELTSENYLTKGSLVNPTFVDVKTNGSVVDSYTVYYYVECDNYTGVNGSKTVTISKRPVVIKAANESKNYDSQELTFVDRNLNDTMYSLLEDTSLATKDKITMLTFTGAITDVGTVMNVPSAAVIKNNNGNGTDVTENYDISYENGTLTITQAEAKITLNGNMDKTYDGLSVADPTEKQEDVPNDKVVYEKQGDGEVSFKYYTKVSDGSYVEVIGGRPKNAGVYYVKAFTSETQNYKAAESNFLKFIIEKRKVELTAENKTSVYGKDMETLTYTQGQVKIIPEEMDGFMITPVTEATKASKVGTYTISIHYEENDNYEITVIPGVYTITNATLNVEATGITAEYDGNKYGITVTATATAIPGDSDKIQIYYSDKELDSSNYQTVGSTNKPMYQYVRRNKSVVDSYKVYYYVVCENYDGVAGSKNVTITPRTLEITADSAFAKYTPDQPLTKQSYTITGGTSLLSTDKITDITITGSQETKGSSLNVPSGAIIKSENGTGVDVTGCYEISYEPGTLAVDVQLQEIEANDLTITYDGKAHNMKEIVAEATGDSVLEYAASIDGTDATEITNVGTMQVTITAPETDKYAFCVKKVMLTVKSRVVTVSADSASKVYDGEELSKHAFSVTEGTVADNEEMIVTYTSESAITLVGQCENVIEGITVMHGDTDVTSNYEIARENGSLEITKREITIKANDMSKIYDGEVLSYENLPFKEEMCSLSKGTLAADEQISQLSFVGKIVNVGTAITSVSQAVITNAKGDDVTDNYEISYEDGQLSVEKANSKITLTGKLDKIYDGSRVTNPISSEISQKDGASYTKTGDGIVRFKYYVKVDDAYKELEDGAPTLAGDYFVKAYVDATDNFTSAESEYLPFTIAKRKLVITAESEQKNYDGTQLSFTGRAFSNKLFKITDGSLASGDSLVNMKFAGTITQVGTEMNIPSDAVIKNASGKDVSTSYDITYVNGKLEVIAAAKPAEITTNPSTPSENTMVSNPSNNTISGHVPSEGGISGNDNQITDSEDKDDASSKGGLQVITDTLDKKENEKIDHTKHFDVKILDQESLVHQVLSREEGKYIENGGTGIIRIQIERLNDQQPDKSLLEYMDSHFEKLLGVEENVVFKKYIRLNLEKKIGDKNWEKFLAVDEELPITIVIPTEMIVAGEKLYLVCQGSEACELLEDMDDDPTTITIMTKDFDSNYALIAVVDEDVLVDDTVSKSDSDCFMHWIILLLMILSSLVAIFYWKKEETKGEDELSEHEATVKILRKKGHVLLVVVLNGLGIICVILGSCKWDILVETVGMIVTILLEYLKKQFIRDEKNQ